MWTQSAHFEGALSGLDYLNWLVAHPFWGLALLSLLMLVVMSIDAQLTNMFRVLVHLIDKVFAKKE